MAQRICQPDSLGSPPGDELSGDEFKPAGGEAQGQEFASIGLAEFLDHDNRPTFVLDLQNTGLEAQFLPVFLNNSLCSDQQLLQALAFKSKPVASQFHHSDMASGFKSWIQDITRFNGIGPSTQTLFAGLLWTGFKILKKWLVVSGYQPSPSISHKPSLLTEARVNKSSELPAKKYNEIPRRPKRVLSASEDEKPILRGHDSFPASYITTGTPDWTIKNPEGKLSEHVMFARSVDWSATALGDMSSWSREFRQVACLLMANPHPAALFWGEELTVIYNKAYADQVAGEKHPMLMGTGFQGPFSELWDLVEQIFHECQRTGKSVAVTEQMLPIARRGFVEETFYTWSLIPLYGGTKELQGLYNAPFETTRQTRGARALQTLLMLGQETALAKSVSTFWPQILRALSDSVFDFPFVFLYSVSDDIEDERESQCSENSQSFRSCILEGSLGIPEGHPMVPPRLDLKRSHTGFVPSLRDAMQTREPKLLSIRDGTLSPSLMDNFEFRGFGEPCREAIVCPIRPTSGENVMGFLVAGVNPRREFDEDYQSFIQLINRQLATSLASVTLLESEIQRSHTAAAAAALERSRLSEELAVQKSRLQRMAEVSPVGMYSVDPSGLLLEANDRWFEITGHSHDPSSVTPMSWMNVIHEKSIEAMERGWKRLTVDMLPWSAELQLKKPWYDPNSGEEIDNWILAAAQPEFLDGKLRSVMGSCTDITLQKRSAKYSEARAKLSEQLLLRTQEAKENEKNFKRFSDLAPGGLVIMDPKGKITYANSQWLTISGHPQNEDNSVSSLSWRNVILESDRPYYASKWEELTNQKATITFEVRMQTPWEGEIGESIVKIQRWILASVSPEVSEDGILLSVMGCITDISRIKWAESLQSRRLKEAEETRRSTNNFIDITSHEMRNPLSAILQCADGIATSLSELISDPRVESLFSTTIRESISSAETIQLCAQHQKSIVDDILTISKLDSNLLLITPVPIQPVEIVKQALQMFLVECQKVHDIKLEFHIDQTLRDLEVDVVMLDSSRLLQVLINLMTNAIKFTKTCPKRTIDVSIAASTEPPGALGSNFEYFPTKKARSDPTSSSEWGGGDVLFLRLEVRDSGCGLTSEEKKRLFNRFSQASPRTHVQYGGSGLGLFISRQLTELQGGEIGVASDAGVGSTFAFYVKARRATEQQSLGDVQKQLSSDLESNAVLASNVIKGMQNQEASGSNQLKVTDVGLQPAQRVSPPSASDPSDWHVLVVEDNLVNQKVLAQQLRKLGCVVYIANHGGEALSIIKESKHYRGHEIDGRELSVILMDLEMPIMDGLTCVRKIREMEKEGEIIIHLPIIAVTANARGEQILTAIDTGMDDVMTKPFRIMQIRGKIESLLDKTGK